MDPIIGYCGLDCSGCPIHLATLESDPEKKHQMRVDVAIICKERYGLSFESEDISDCDGCRSTRLFVTCARCAIRRCAQEKKFESCASCEEFACETLQKIFLDDPAACTRLEALRNLT